MLESMCGKKFHHVLREFGFTEVPETVFTKSDIATVHRDMPEFPASHRLTAKQLAQSAQKGRIMSVATRRDGVTLWTVEFYCLSYRCVFRFAHRREEWTTDGTPHIEQVSAAAKWTPRSWHFANKYPFIFDASMIMLLVAVSFAFGNVWGKDTHRTVEAGNPTIDAEDALQLVKDEGHIVLTPEEQDELIAQARSEAYAQAEEAFAAQLEEQQRAAEEKAKQEAEKKAKAEKEADKEKEKEDKKKKEKEKDKEKKPTKEKEKVLVFTMRDGMPIQDLVKALKKHDFIKDENAFVKQMEAQDLITNVKVGDYEFSSDMSEADILNSLKR